MQRDAGTSGKRRDTPCRLAGAALRVAPRRTPAASRASTVFPDTLFGPLLADRTPGRDAGRDPGEKCGLDGKRRRALGHEIKQALSLIRRAHPAMADVSVRKEYGRATLVLGLEGALRDAAFAAWSDGGASAPSATGHAAFDALGAGLGLRAVQAYPALDSAVLYLDERANVAAALRAYRAIEGVGYAEPDAVLGDGSDIEAAKVDGRWHFVFRLAWGDCPAGCIDEELSFFTVADGEARLIEPARARGMDAFAALVATRGWR